MVERFLEICQLCPSLSLFLSKVESPKRKLKLRLTNGMFKYFTGEGKLLKLLLNEVDLDFVQFLPSILMLQNSFIQRYVIITQLCSE